MPVGPTESPWRPFFCSPWPSNPRLQVSVSHVFDFDVSSWIGSPNCGQLPPTVISSGFGSTEHDLLEEFLGSVEEW